MTETTRSRPAAIRCSCSSLRNFIHPSYLGLRGLLSSAGGPSPAGSPNVSWSSRPLGSVWRRPAFHEPEQSSGHEPASRRLGDGCRKWADRFVGIDVSKARVDVHVRPDGTAFGCATDAEGLGVLIDRQSASGAQVRRRHRPAGQDRCDRRRGARPLRPGRAPGGAGIAR